MKKLGLIAFKILVSSGILYVLFSRVDLAVFWQMASEMPVALIVFSIVLFFAIQFTSVCRWTLVLRKDVDAGDVRFKDIFSMYFIGMFFNNFLPTLVGGDVIKSYYLFKLTKKGGLSVASILIDRYSGFTALMGITLVSLVAGWRVVRSAGGVELVAVFVLIIGAFVLGSAFLWIEALHGRLVGLLGKIHLMGLNKKMDTLYKALMKYKARKDLLIRIFLLSLLVQGGGIVLHIILGKGLGMDVPVLYYFLFVPLSVTASMAPVSLAGLGIREGVLVFLFTKAGATQEQALGMGLLYFIIVVCVSLVGAVAYVRAGRINGP